MISFIILTYNNLCFLGYLSKTNVVGLSYHFCLWNFMEANFSFVFQMGALQTHSKTFIFFFCVARKQKSSLSDEILFSKAHFIIWFLLNITNIGSIFFFSFLRFKFLFVLDFFGFFLNFQLFHRFYSI